MRGYDVDFFIRENGDCPVKEFLPRAEIATAKKYRAEYIERKESLS